MSALDYIPEDEHFLIASTTLGELEEIKTSSRKDEATKYNARRAVNWLISHLDLWDTIVYCENMYDSVKQLPQGPDSEIIACAIRANWSYGNVILVTNDLLMSEIASKVSNLIVKRLEKNEENEEYTGFKTISPTDDELAEFYSNTDKNLYDLKLNQFLIIENSDGDVIDTFRWDGQEHQRIFKKIPKSKYFDKLKAKDVYQSCAIDSLVNCTITAISGKAGSGKSLLALMVASYLIEQNKYDRLVILFNPTKTRGASDMGFYGGDALEKAMQNSIGQILTTKFGDRYAIDLLLSQDKIKLVSMADARGMEIRDNEILWITECQNTSIDLIKLCLSRVSSGAKVFIEGDYKSQVDARMYEGSNNGLKRVIDVFKGHEEFGYVQLQNVWRSKIAELCELL